MESKIFDIKMEYELDNNNVVITKLSTYKETIIVPDEIEYKFVTKLNKIDIINAKLDDNCFCFNTPGKFIHLPQTLIELGDVCFTEVKNVEEIIIPESLQTIGKSCFKNLKHLKKVLFRNTNLLKEISESCFEGCLHLHKIDLPKNIEKIDSKAFYGIKKLDLYIGNKIQFIAPDAFECVDKSKIVIHFPKDFDYKFLNLPDFIECLNDNICFGDDRSFKINVKNGVVKIFNIEGYMSYVDFPDFIIKEGIKYKVDKIVMSFTKAEDSYYYPFRRISIGGIKYLELKFIRPCFFCYPIIIDHDMDCIKTNSLDCMFFVKNGVKITEFDAPYTIKIKENADCDYIEKAYKLYDQICDCSDIKLSEINGVAYGRNDYIKGNIDNILYENHFLYLIRNEKNACVLKYNNVFKKEEIIIPPFIKFKDKEVPVTLCMPYFTTYSHQTITIGKNIKIIMQSTFNSEMHSVKFEDESILNFIDEFNFNSVDTLVKLPPQIKLMLGLGFNFNNFQKSGFIFDDNAQIKYVGPVLERFKGNTLPKSIVYFSCGWPHVAPVNEIEFENDSNILVFDCIFKSIFKNKQKFGGCVYTGPKSNPYMILIDTYESWLPSYTIHKDCKCITYNAFCAASNLCSLELNEGLVSYLCCFSNSYNVPTIKKWPKSLKFINEDALTYPRFLCIKETSEPLSNNLSLLKIYDEFRRLDGYTIGGGYNVKNDLHDCLIGNLLYEMHHNSFTFNTVGFKGYAIDLISRFQAKNTIIELKQSGHIISDFKYDFKMQQVNCDDAIPMTIFTYKYDGILCNIFMDRLGFNLRFNRIDEDEYCITEILPDYLLLGLDYIANNII